MSTTTDSSKATPFYARFRRDLAAAPKTWLVTGVAGFIGSSLLEELLSLGQRVVGLDNFSTGYQSNLDHALASSGARTSGGSFRLIEGDIRDLESCRAACAGVDYVLHHAALGSVPRSVDDPVTSNHVNVDGTLNMFIAAREASVQRVVYASSSAVYGDVVDLPQVERSTGRPLSPYAATKAANEMYAGAFQAAYGLQLIGLRYFNVFGRRQDPNGAYAAVIPRWVSTMFEGESCRIFGDGSHTRDYVYVKDVVQANVLAACADASATNEVYNVGRGQSTSLLELFELVRSTLTSFDPSRATTAPVHEGARTGDILKSVASIDKAQRRLGFEPVYDIATGLSEAFDWYARSANRSTPIAGFADRTSKDSSLVSASVIAADDWP